MPYLFDKLVDYTKSDYYPFHMPGHKRNLGSFPNPFEVDITEIDGFDNLHHAEGILRQVQERAAKLYHSENTYYLVNGSTAGILSAISACTKIGSRVLVARNCHKAVYHGILIRKLQSEYIYPQQEEQTGINCGLDPEKIRRLLIKYPDIQAVVITSPTYDGVVSDVSAIANICHDYGKPLIVDEAHGAHFGFHPYFPESSIKKGADIVIQSLHKTLPSFTQTAIIHVNGKLVDREKLQMYLGIYQTSSPSYILMSGMDQCIRMIEEEGDRLFEAFVLNLREFRNSIQELSCIRLVGADLQGSGFVHDFDHSKLVLYTENNSVNGIELYERLRKDFHIQLEMAAGNYALALSTLGDTREGFERLFRALKEIDRELSEKDTVFLGKHREKRVVQVSEQVQEMAMDEAMEREKKAMKLEKSEGRISGEFLYLYPPGIPLIVPGERIDQKLLESIFIYREKGFSLQGMKDYESKRIEVII